MHIEPIRALVADELQAVDQLIENNFEADIALIGELSRHLISSGGKRLRPMMLLLCARSLGYEGADHIKLAAVLEYVHTATLLHDDVVDSSELRRGQKTANTIWGNQASVLVGDYLYSRSFQMMVEVEDLSILNIIARATNIIARGEVLQLIHCNDPDTSETRYLEIIQSKTATLFSVAAEAGAILGEAQYHQRQALKNYGLHMGIAFQLIDDALDYSADRESLGKNIGDDLAEGKPTLPLIYVLQHGNDAQKQLIQQAIREGGLDDIAAIQAAIKATDAIAYTHKIAQQQVAEATQLLTCLPDSQYRNGLLDLAEFALHRTH